MATVNTTATAVVLVAVRVGGGSASISGIPSDIDVGRVFLKIKKKKIEIKPPACL